jgi:hypothetical protein
MVADRIFHLAYRARLVSKVRCKEDIVNGTACMKAPHLNYTSNAKIVSAPHDDPSFYVLTKTDRTFLRELCYNKFEVCSLA